MSDPRTTHFGYETVDEASKAARVAGVFHSVAARYDLMNDLMSAGLHRAWKAFTIGQAAVRPGMRVLDVAGGTGDLARAHHLQLTAFRFCLPARVSRGLTHRRSRAAALGRFLR